MARPKEFDTQAALDKAIQVFWHKGYEATSTRDLVAAMGIGRQSLYDTYGDKQSLFVAALDSYQERMVGPVLAKLDAPQAGLAEIRSYFNKVVRNFTAGSRRACLMINSTVELVAKEEAVSQSVGRHLARLHQVFTRALSQGGERGEIPALDVKAVAWVLTNTAVGLGVLAKGGTPRPALQSVVDSVLTMLEPP